MLPAISLENQFGVRLQPVRIGQTNVNFQAPSSDQVANQPPGNVLAAAAQSLLNYFQSSGVPSEHTNNSQVMAFQTAWNGDPLSDINGSNSNLSQDGGYGPNTMAALASINGGSAPPVNTGPAGPPGPVGPPGPAPIPGGGSTTNTTFFFGWPLWEQALAVAAAAGAAVLGTTALMKTGPGKKVAGHARRIHGRAVHHARRMTHRLRGKHA